MPSLTTDTRVSPADVLPSAKATVLDVVQPWARYHGWTEREQVHVLCRFFDTAYVDDDGERHRYTYAQSLHRWLRGRVALLGPGQVEPPPHPDDDLVEPEDYEPLPWEQDAEADRYHDHLFRSPE